MRVTLILLFFCFIGTTEAQTDWKNFTQTGKAARYDSTWHNVSTRSGELIDMSLFEGAHADLPFGTVIEVTNLENQRTVKLRINERPYTKSRILDMTLAAADSLNFADKKVIAIRLKVIALKVRRQKSSFKKSTKYLQVSNTQISGVKIPKKTTSLSLPKKTPTTTRTKTFQGMSTYTVDGLQVQIQGYGLQVGSYFDIEYAVKIAKNIKNLEIEKVFIQSGWNNEKQVFRVLVGIFSTKEASYYTRDLLKQHDYTAFAKKHY